MVDAAKNIHAWKPPSIGGKSFSRVFSASDLELHGSSSRFREVLELVDEDRSVSIEVDM
jgi:hypothetical protein